MVEKGDFLRGDPQNQVVTAISSCYIEFNGRKSRLPALGGSEYTIARRSVQPAHGLEDTHE